ncbi:hypothetical protein ACFX2A_032526 [Malus domestica]
MNGGKMLIVCLYVDLIFTGNDESMFEEFKHSMMIEFDMTDLGRISYFLGLEVLQRSEVHNHIVPGFKMMKNEG